MRIVALIFAQTVVSNLEYADDIVLLNEGPSELQVSPDRQNGRMRTFGVRFAPSKCEILLQNWADLKPNPVFAKQQLDVVDRSGYLGNFTSPGDRISDEVPSSIQKARLTFTSICGLGVTSGH